MCAIYRKLNYNKNWCSPLECLVCWLSFAGCSLFVFSYTLSSSTSHSRIEIAPPFFYIYSISFFFHFRRSLLLKCISCAYMRVNVDGSSCVLCLVRQIKYIHEHLSCIYASFASPLSSLSSTLASTQMLGPLCSYEVWHEIGRTNTSSFT